MIEVDFIPKGYSFCAYNPFRKDLSMGWVLITYAVLVWRGFGYTVQVSVLFLQAKRSGMWGPA